MNKKEFLEYIDDVEKMALNDYPVCSCLCGISLGRWGARKAFQANFSKCKTDFGQWLDSNRWHNARDGMTNIERRLVFLESFKNWCLVYKEYKEF